MLEIFVEELNVASLVFRCVITGEHAAQIADALPVHPASILTTGRCLRFRLIVVLTAMRYSHVKNCESPLKLASDWYALRKASLFVRVIAHKDDSTVASGVAYPAKLQDSFGKFFYKQKVIEEMALVAENIHDKIQLSLRTIQELEAQRKSAHSSNKGSSIGPSGRSYFGGSTKRTSENPRRFSSSSGVYLVRRNSRKS